MFKRLKEHLYKNQEQVALPLALKQIENIRLQGSEIILTPMPHGNNWRGIYNGAIAFLPGQVFSIPQLYSKPALSDEQIRKVCNHITELNFKKIILSGYTPAFRSFITDLNSLNQRKSPETKVYLIHHSSFSSNREEKIMLSALEDIISLYGMGAIHRIGFIKKGMAETFQSLHNLNAHHLIPVTYDIPEEVRRGADLLKGVHCGVFTHFAYRKNIDNQVAAALQIKDAVVHVHERKGLDYLGNTSRILEHSFIEDYHSFLRLIGSMTLNFYVTLSECFGLFISESLSMGVPCLAANNSGIFDYDDYLQQWLLVDEYDNSHAIYHKAMRALENREELSRRGMEYIKKINEIARQKFEHFLNG